MLSKFTTEVWRILETFELWIRNTLHEVLHLYKYKSKSLNKLILEDVAVTEPFVKWTLIKLKGKF